MSVWDEALPKIDVLIAEHKRGKHRDKPVGACVSCLFSQGKKAD